MIDTGYNIKVSKALQATAMLKGQEPFPYAAEIESDNAKGEKRMSEGDYLRMCKADRTAKNIIKAMQMSKAIVIIASKKISRQIPDEEVGESDLPKGTMKYDEIPDGPNIFGGGAGRTETFTPMRSGGGAMLNNNVMGQEMLRTMADSLLRAKKEKDEGSKDPSRKIKDKTNK